MSEIEDFLNDTIKEVTQLRYSIPDIGPEHSQLYVLETLMEIRHRLDRVEELLLQVVRIRGRLKRAASAASAVLDEAWDEESRKQRTSSRGTILGDYSAAKERYADVNLSVLDKKREARRAEELASIASDAYEYIKTAYWGLDGARRDITAIIGAYHYGADYIDKDNKSK